MIDGRDGTRSTGPIKPQSGGIGGVRSPDTSIPRLGRSGYWPELIGTINALIDRENDRAKPFWERKPPE